MEDAADAAYSREQAAKCLRLAANIHNPDVALTLRNMATHYEVVAKRLDDGAQDVVSAPAMPPPRVE